MHTYKRTHALTHVHARYTLKGMVGIAKGLKGNGVVKTLWVQVLV
jgi:hypothetical protein